MNPTNAYYMGHARLAELHRRAQRDALASAMRRPRWTVDPTAGRPSVMARWAHRLGRAAVS